MHLTPVLRLCPPERGPNCAECEQTIAVRARRKSTAQGSSTLPPSSAKVRMMLQLLHTIEHRSDGLDKTIIFTQFTSMMDLIEPFLKDAGFHYVRC